MKWTAADAPVANMRVLESASGELRVLTVLHNPPRFSIDDLAAEMGHVACGGAP